MEEKRLSSVQAEQAFQVFVRIRPMTKKELEVATSKVTFRNIVRAKDAGEVVVLDPYDPVDVSKGKAYAFDCVFTESHCNQYVFSSTVSPLVPHVLEGINATCFAYGMTGAGKTHTMLGDIYRSTTGEEGICSMAIESIFKLISMTEKQCKVKMSYLEIYNERVIDLLGYNASTTGLMIVEDPLKGVSVPELTEYEVYNTKELLELVLKGNQRRTMAETSTNQFSSRSHAILQIGVESSSKNYKGISEILTSKLSLVDLAGSERACNSENKGLRMLEGGKINRSLLALGNCINILSDKTKASTCFVPYRDSKLTRLLKDSLGGNTKTIMIACVAPGGNSYEETVNTLKYAERAKKIKKMVGRNAKEMELTTAQYKEIVENLKSEITSLKEKMTFQQNQTPSVEYPPVIVKHQNDISLKELDLEIRKTKAMKDKCQEELMKSSSVVMQSLKASQCELLEDDTHLYKLSQELLSKYEEHYEMKQSVQELNELNAKNTIKLAKLQSELDEYVKAKIAEDLPKEQQDKIQAAILCKAKEIEALQRAIDGNESIKKQIEESLKENAAIQQKYLALVVKLQNHKKKDILELQISVRTLKLERMDLMMQNLEMQKLKRIAELENQGKDKELAKMREELEQVKAELKRKEKALANSASKIQSQKKELKAFKGKSWVSEKKQKPATKRTQSKGNDVINTSANHKSGRYLALSFSKPGEYRELNKEILRIDDEFDYLSDGYGGDEGNQKEKPELDESFISLSSVTVNYEDAPSNTDIELAHIDNVPVTKAKPSKKTERSGSLNNKNINQNRKTVGTSNLRNPLKESKGGYFSNLAGSYAKLINRITPRKEVEKKERTIKQSPNPVAKTTSLADTNESIIKSTRNITPALLADNPKFGVINLYNITHIQNATTVNFAHTPSLYSSKPSGVSKVGHVVAMGKHGIVKDTNDILSRPHVQSKLAGKSTRKVVPSSKHPGVFSP